MTYSSRTFFISWGLGSLSRVRSARSSSSSRIMSLHSSTHSSQTKTLGPAMSFRTSCWLFPQKEQYKSLPSSCLPRESSLMLSSNWPRGQPQGRPAMQLQYRLYSTPQPARKDKVLQGVTGFRTKPRDVKSGVHQADLSLCGDLAAFFDHRIDQTIGAGLLGGHKVVPVAVGLDALDGLTAVLGQYGV